MPSNAKSCSPRLSPGPSTVEYYSSAVTEGHTAYKTSIEAFRITHDFPNRSSIKRPLKLPSLVFRFRPVVTETFPTWKELWLKAGGGSHTVATPPASKTRGGQEVMRKTKSVQSRWKRKGRSSALRVKIQGVCQIYCKAHKSSFQGVNSWLVQEEGWGKMRMRCRWNRGEKRLTLIP